MLFLRKIVGDISPYLLLTQLTFPRHASTFHQQDKKVLLDVSRAIFILTSIIIRYYYLKSRYQRISTNGNTTPKVFI